jgi:hypothetical protein
MLELCKAKLVTKLAMPRIGTGLDDLEWHLVARIINDVFSSSNIKITVYTESQQAPEAQLELTYRQSRNLRDQHDDLHNQIRYSKPRVAQDSRIHPKPHTPAFPKMPTVHEMLSLLQSLPLSFLSETHEKCNAHSTTGSAANPDVTPTFVPDVAHISHLLSYAHSYGHPNHDPLITLDTEIEQTYVVSLIDTGATANYISQTTLFQLDPNEKFCIERYERAVQVGDKTVVKSLGRVTLPVTIDGSTFDTAFVILQNLTFEVVLGMNFLVISGAIIDAADRSIIFTKAKINRVQLTESIELSAFTCMSVAVRSSIPATSPQFLHNLPEFTIRHGAHVTQGPIAGNDDAMIVYLSNLTGTSINFSAGTEIGQLTCLEQYQVVADEAFNGIFESDFGHPQQRPSTPSDAPSNSDEIIINSDALNNEQQATVRELVRSFEDVFAAILAAKSKQYKAKVKVKVKVKVKASSIKQEGDLLLFVLFNFCRLMA